VISCERGSCRSRMARCKQATSCYAAPLGVLSSGARVMKKIAAVGALTLGWAVGIGADDWPAATVQTVFSDNGRYFVRIVPGESVRDTVGFAGQPKGRYARGEFYERHANRSYALIADVPLQNPVSPTDALVTNGGYLLTFDNWHNFGYGEAVAIYQPGGRLVRALTLEQLYPADQLRKIPMSVSSRWWRCSPHGFVDPGGQTEIYVFDYLGGTFTFNVQTGAFQYQPGRKSCDPPKGPFSASWFGR